MSFLEGLTSAVGEILGEITGHLMTRLTAEALGKAQVSRGTGTLSSVDGVNLTLSAGVFSAQAVVGTIVRSLSGSTPGAQGAITAGAAGTNAATIAGPGIGVVAGISWEVERPAATTLQVETTLYFQTSGYLYLGGLLHRYSGVTPTSFTGLEHFDGVDWFPGVATTHAAGTIVVDWSRQRTALDLLRRSFFAETADSNGLEILGRNHGRLRRPGLEPLERFRSWLRATMFAPLGTDLGVVQVLQALLGNAWETFVDYTSPSDDFARFFVRRTDEVTNSLVGRAVLDGSVLVMPGSTTSITLPETPTRVSSVILAPEISWRVVASGSGASSADGITIDGPASSFPARVRKGDVFEVTAGPFEGTRATVLARVSDIELTLGYVPGHSPSVLPGASTTFAWRIVRETTCCRFARPSTDVALEYDADPGTTAWTWQGTLAGGEAAGATVATDTTLGDHLHLGSGTNGETSYYRRQARITALSEGALDVLVAPDTPTVTSATDGRQWSVQIHDGERAIAAGFFDVTGSDDGIAFINSTTGAAIGSIVTLPATAAKYRRVRIVKRGRGTVELWVDNLRVATAAHADFVASAVHELRFGCLSTTVAAFADVRDVAWALETPTDFWASRSTAATTTNGSSNIGGLSGILGVGDVGKILVISGADAKNAGGGTANGEWRVTARVDANTATVTGRTREGATFRRGHPARIFLPEDEALIWPSALGHQLEILNGDDAGVYDISALLDDSYNDLDDQVPATGDLVLADLEPAMRQRSIIVEVANPPTGGFSATDGEYQWRIVPVFATDASLTAELSDTGTVAGPVLTLAQALPIAAPLPVVEVLFSTFNSAHAEAEATENTGTRWPFYLYDPWGAFRDLILAEAAAGILVDLDSLSRDASGLHISED